MEKKITAYYSKEKVLLASLVNKYNIVENKKTDAATIQIKNQAWEKIAREYNSQGDMINATRTPLQLKKLWNNLKQRKRKATTQMHYQRLATGGGPAEYVPEDPVMEAVDIAAPHTDTTIYCPWDSTALFVTDQDNFTSLPKETESAETTNILSETIVLQSGTPEPDLSEVIPDHNTPTTSKPSTSVNPSVKSKRTGTINSIGTEVALRVEKMRVAIQQQEELHNIRMRIEQEQLRTAIAIREKAEAEKELAELQLYKFKEN